MCSKFCTASGSSRTSQFNSSRKWNWQARNAEKHEERKNAQTLRKKDRHEKVKDNITGAIDERKRTNKKDAHCTRRESDIESRDQCVSSHRSGSSGPLCRRDTPAKKQFSSVRVSVEKAFTWTRAHPKTISTVIHSHHSRRCIRIPHVELGSHEHARARSTLG